MNTETTVKPQGKIYHRGFWQIAYKAYALCPDGKYRMCTITSEPDTFFSIPASVKFHGVTVTGFIMQGNSSNFEIQELCFHPNKWGMNGNAFPEVNTSELIDRTFGISKPEEQK